MPFCNIRGWYLQTQKHKYFVVKHSIIQWDDKKLQLHQKNEGMDLQSQVAFLVL